LHVNSQRLNNCASDVDSSVIVPETIAGNMRLGLASVLLETFQRMGLRSLRPPQMRQQQGVSREKLNSLQSDLLELATGTDCQGAVVNLSLRLLQSKRHSARCLSALLPVQSGYTWMFRPPLSKRGWLETQAFLISREYLKSSCGCEVDLLGTRWVEGKCALGR
jgi:hypothetical protein